MKYAVMYGAAIGLVVAAVETGLVEEAIGGPLYIAFAVAGLALIFVGLLTRE